LLERSCNGSHDLHKVLAVTEASSFLWQVARRSSPAEDAAAIAAVRKAVGEGVTIRADANRRWNLEEATAFGLAVKGLDLQYVEVSGRTWIFARQEERTLKSPVDLFYFEECMV
jgi:hypothetical protein